MGRIISGTGNVLIGIGLALAAPIVVPRVVAAARPLAKAAIRGGLALGESVRSTVDRVRKEWGDLVSEAKAERAARQAACPVKPAVAPASPA